MSDTRRYPPIFLIGMMGAGKSTVGRQLSADLGISFLDMDKELEKRCGIGIPVIFATEGEVGFRKRESDFLQELKSRFNTVIATGGGVVLSEENRRELKNSGALVVHLEVGFEQCYERTRNSDRPLLQCEDPLLRIKEILLLRTPLYESAAHVTFKTNGKNSFEVANEIKAYLGRIYGEDEK